MIVYQDNVKTTLLIDKFQERFDSSEQGCLSAGLQNKSVSGDKHAALTASHKKSICHYNASKSDNFWCTQKLELLIVKWKLTENLVVTILYITSSHGLWQSARANREEISGGISGGFPRKYPAGKMCGGKCPGELSGGSVQGAVVNTHTRARAHNYTITSARLARDWFILKKTFRQAECNIQYMATEIHGTKFLQPINITLLIKDYYYVYFHFVSVHINSKI